MRKLLQPSVVRNFVRQSLTLAGSLRSVGQGTVESTSPTDNDLTSPAITGALILFKVDSSEWRER